ncbi:MAG: response regulator [Anaerolineae bacterium]|nr:response regulator [Anaerolineae bacterium]
MDPRPKILTVDDKRENLFTLEKILEQLDVDVFQVTSGLEALALALEYDFFVAIVDVQMPEMDGYEFVELLRGNESTATLPVIFVSAIYSDEYHYRKGYDAGAVDFLSKPFIPEVLLSKVRVFLDLYRQRQQLESLVLQLNTANDELSKFALQLKTGARVSQQITSILELEPLLQEVVDLIAIGFGCYLVGVWLISPSGDTVALKACSQPSSGPLLNRDYELPIEAERGIISHVCRTVMPYLTDDVHGDSTYLAVDVLKNTVSELAIPLKIGTENLGVLDIQSDRPGVFVPETVDALQILADQIAIAIRNARLYAAVLRFNSELEDRVQERTAELERAYTQLEMLDRHKSEFIQVISHELRTPLSLVKGFSQILLREPHLQEDEGTRMQVEGIVSGAERMHDIINSMLEVVRIDNKTLELNLQWLDIGDLLFVLCESLAAPLAERHLTLTLEEFPDMPEIYADIDALNRLFNHLLYNAIKYTPDGGSITLSGRFWPSADNNQANSFVEIVVSDTGIGIDAKVQELIFTKFYQAGPVAFHSTGKTKFKGGGAGLGLSIARGVVEAHGGRIWVESEGHDEQKCPGSKFHVVLPIKQALSSQADMTARVAALYGHSPQ